MVVRLLNRQPYFFMLLALSGLASCLLLLLNSPAGVVRQLNSFHHSTLDTFFRQYTFTGDGLLTIMMVLVMLEKKTLPLQLLPSFLILMASPFIFYSYKEQRPVRIADHYCTDG